MARPKTPRRRRQPLTRAILRLMQDYRLWAMLPPHIAWIGLHTEEDGGVSDTIGEVHRPTFPRGICRQCGCSQYDLCLTKIGPCGWANNTRTLCTACEART